MGLGCTEAMLVEVAEDTVHAAAIEPCRLPRAQGVGSFSLFHTQSNFGSALGYASIEISALSPVTVSAQV